MIKKQRGVTMIELMISMVLGLGLIAGIGQLFIQSQKSFKLQRNVSDMTDDGVFLLEVLAKSIIQTGQSEEGLSDVDGGIQYFPSATATDLPAIPSVDTLVDTGIADITTLGAGEFIRGTDDATTGNSQLVYRYNLASQIDLDHSICTSSGISYIPPDPTDDTVPSDRTSTSVGSKTNKNIMVRVYVELDSGVPVFFCKASKIVDSTNNAAATSADRQPLVSDVAKLVFRYGVQNRASGKFYYATAAAVTAANAWKDVFAVKVFVVLRSADDNVTRSPQTYSVDGVSTTATDNRVYKVFSKTIFLRATIK